MNFYTTIGSVLKIGGRAVRKFLTYCTKLRLIMSTKAEGSPARGLRFFKWRIIQKKDLDEIINNSSHYGLPNAPQKQTESPEEDASILAIQNVQIERLREKNPETLQDQDEYSDDEEDYDEHQLVWGPILEIPDENFVSLLSRLLELNPDDPFADTPKVEKRTEGSYNHVVILTYNITKYVVKVPMVGIEDRWHPGHAEIMRSEAHTMMYIKKKLPNFPIPIVHFYDVTFDNEIGAPFHVLSFIEGKSSGEMWFEMDEDDEFDFVNADCPSKEREQLRVTFLKSLAKHMADLRHLEFDGIGMLRFENDDPETVDIGPYHGWIPYNLEATLRRYYERPVYNNAADSYAERLASKFGKDSNNRTTGMQMILEHLYQSQPFSASTNNEDEHETFVLHHNDLDFQNVFVNDDGEVTGILDWDGVSTVPRCVGYSTVPIFLYADWEYNYKVPEAAIHSPWTLTKYRRIYANAMKQACGGLDTDAKYTEKSAMYGVIHDLLFGDHPTTYMRAEDFIQKLLCEIPLLRRVEDIESFATAIGNGWEEPNEILKEMVPRILQWANV
jgi:hypothetical protein